MRERTITLSIITSSSCQDLAAGKMPLDRQSNLDQKRCPGDHLWTLFLQGHHRGRVNGTLHEGP